MKYRRRGTSRTRPINGNGRAIGLDLGSTSLRATSLTLNTEGEVPSVTVHGSGSVPLPPGAIVNGAVVDQALVTDALKRLWATNSFHGNKVILGVASPQVVVRPLSIPNLDAHQRAKALPFQAREIIALPLDEVILDFTEVGEPDPETGFVPGLLIATPRRPVLTVVDAVERAGLKVVRVDLSAFGALRAIGDERLVVQAVIDFGAQLTSIVIHHRGVPQLVRTVARGGQELTNLLVDKLDLSLAEAEALKCETGLVDRGDAATEALQAGIRPLLAEIRGSINYFRAGSDNVRIERISLTGGGSALPGLAAALERQHGVPTWVVIPMERIVERQARTGLGTANPDHGASATSIGLAMGAAA